MYILLNLFRYPRRPRYRSRLFDLRPSHPPDQQGKQPLDMQVSGYPRLHTSR